VKIIDVPMSLSVVGRSYLTPASLAMHDDRLTDQLNLDKHHGPGRPIRVRGWKSRHAWTTIFWGKPLPNPLPPKPSLMSHR
jgi:hypothetical protein